MKQLFNKAIRLVRGEPKPETRVTSYNTFQQKWQQRELEKQGWTKKRIGNTDWMVSP